MRMDSLQLFPDFALFFFVLMVHCRGKFVEWFVWLIPITSETGCMILT